MESNTKHLEAKHGARQCLYFSDFILITEVYLPKITQLVDKWSRE